MIAEYFKENISLLQRGENSYCSGNVVKMIFDPACKPCLLKGEITASMKKRLYNVEIFIDPEDGIINGTCSCPRGQVLCHHMAAICIYAHHNVSITDQACAWTAPKKPEAVEKMPKVKDMFPLKQGPYVALTKPVSNVDLDTFKQQLKGYTVGFSWLLRPDPTESSSIITNIEDILFCAEYINASDKNTYILNKCSITADLIQNVAQITTGQASNENWLLARKLRLTGSKFGEVLAACSRRRYPRSLFINLTEGYNLENIQSIQWGRQHEGVAIETFETAMGLKVQPTGLWLHNCGFLGASPDGLIGNDSLVEVKCPFKYRNASLKEVLKNDKKYIAFKNESGETIINKNHNYWHQIQGELCLTKRNICYLIIWTPSECEIVKIQKDEEWCLNIEILKDFYLSRFIPFVISLKSTTV